MSELRIPTSWVSPMPAEALARLIAGVRSRIEAYPTEAALARRRESDGADLVEDDQ